jgi:hypothetical protein
LQSSLTWGSRVLQRAVGLRGLQDPAPHPFAVYASVRLCVCMGIPCSVSHPIRVHGVASYGHSLSREYARLLFSRARQAYVVLRALSLAYLSKPHVVSGGVRHFCCWCANSRARLAFALGRVGGIGAVKGSSIRTVRPGRAGLSAPWFCRGKPANREVLKVWPKNLWHRIQAVICTASVRPIRWRE